MSELITTVKGLGTTKIAIIAGVGALVLIGMIALIATSGGGASKGNFMPLYSGLSMQDGNKIVQTLDAQNVPYRLEGNGTQIMVPEGDVNRIRLTLAGEGLPSSGSVVGYEVFDKSETLGTSDFIYNVNMVRALEGELSRTIGSLNKVSDARVHLVMPKRELFSRERQEPSASVKLDLLPAAELSTSEISAIRHLIATAVPNLKINKITVIDSKGRLLAKGADDPNDPEVAAANAEQFKVTFENRMRKTVEELLESTIGYGKVQAQVSAEIDFDRIVTNTEEFDPEGQVVRSVQSAEEKDQSINKSEDQNVSVESNLPDSEGEGSGESSSLAERTEETTNYEISKKTVNHVKETGTVKRLSVAVLVDGTYTPAEEGAAKYSPRSQEELEQLTALVRSAVGYDEKRGDKVEVVSMQFMGSADQVKEETPLDWIKNDMQSIVQTIVIGLVAVLAMLLIIKPLINRALDAQSEARIREEEEARLALEGPSSAGLLTDMTIGEDGLPRLGGSIGGAFGEDGEEDMINIDRISGKLKSSSLKKINELIEKNPEETVATLRRWIRQDSEI
jgi:flagellar M-ring protein FliF